MILNTCLRYNNSTMTSKIASCLLIVLVNVYSTSSQLTTSTTASTVRGSSYTSETNTKTTYPQTTGLMTSGLSVTPTEVKEDTQTGSSLQTSIASDMTTPNFFTPVVTSASQASVTTKSDSTPTLKTTVVPTTTNYEYETTQSSLTSSTLTTSDSRTTDFTTSASTTGSANRIQSTRADAFESTMARETDTSCKFTTFNCNFNTTQNEETQLPVVESQLKLAYNISFLEMDVSVNCSKTNCEKSCLNCQICPMSEESDTVMLVALVNGITMINTNIDFKSISIDENGPTDGKQLSMTILVGCLSFLVILVIILFVAYVLRKRKYTEKNIKDNNIKRKPKTQRMKKMTLRHISGFSRRIFNTKNTDQDDQEVLEQYECSTRPKLNLPAKDDTENGLTNDGLAEELEPTDVKFSEESFTTNELEQPVEQSAETPPTPIERPLETFRLPCEKNVYVDLTETTEDPIYVNKSAEAMRSGCSGT